MPLRPLLTSLGVTFRLVGFGEDAGLLDFGVPAGLGRLWEGPGVNLVLSPAVNDFALALPKESKYIGLVKTKSGAPDCNKLRINWTIGSETQIMINS